VVWGEVEAVELGAGERRGGAAEAQPALDGRPLVREAVRERDAVQEGGGWGESWPLQEILLPAAFLYESIIRVLPLPTCIAHTIAILPHGYCAINDPLPAPPFACLPPYNPGNGNIV